MSQGHEPETGKAASWLKRLLPWLGTLAIMAWLVWSQDIGAAWDALMQTDLGALAALWLGVVFVAYGMDSFGLWRLFTRINGPIPLAAITRIKGLSYFLNIVNYAAASGGIAWLVAKRGGYRLADTASSILFLNVVDLLVLNVFVTVGLLMAPGGGGDAAMLSEAARSTLLWANVGIYALYFGSMIYWNAGFDFLVLGKLRSWAIFSAFDRATVAIHAELFAVRLVLLVVYIAMQYTAVHLFGIEAPLGAVMVINTVATLIQTLPISVGGLGTVQVTMLELYAPYGTESAILAYSTTSMVVFILIRAAIGYGCMLAGASKPLPAPGQ